MSKIPMSIDFDNLNKKLNNLGYVGAGMSKFENGRIVPIWQSTDQLKDWSKYYMDNDFETSDSVHNRILNKNLNKNFILDTRDIVSEDPKEKELLSYRSSMDLCVHCVFQRDPFWLRFASPETKENFNILKSPEHMRELTNISNELFDFLIFGKDRYLSSREVECLHWAANGKTVLETSIILELSSKTIEKHIGSAIKKLDAANKVHAVFKATELGFIGIKYQRLQGVKKFQSRNELFSDQEDHVEAHHPNMAHNQNQQPSLFHLQV